MIYLTVKTQEGNHGHQLKDYFGALVIAELFDFTFCNTPYEYLDFFALGDGELDAGSLPDDVETLEISQPAYQGLSYEEAKAIFAPVQTRFRNRDGLIVLSGSTRIHPCQTIGWYEKRLIEKDIYRTIISEATQKFAHRHRNRATYFDDSTINVAAHIGRGWEYNRKLFPKLFEPARARKPRYMFPIAYFENIITQLEQIFSHRKYRIHIYTEQRNSEEIVDTFENRNNVVLHIGDNRAQKNYDQIHDIFYHFVTSDILVTCNSSFSVVASYFRHKKINLYHEHSHLFDLPTETNFVTELDGRFDSRRLGDSVPIC